MVPFKLARTDEPLTAPGGVALRAEFTQGRGGGGVTDR